MNHRLLTSNSFNSTTFLNHASLPPTSNLSPALLTRTVKTFLPTSLGGRGGFRLNDVLITDKPQIDQLLALDLPTDPHASSQSAEVEIPLLTGFRASLPSSMDAKNQRRRRRAQLGERILGLDDSSLGLRDKLAAETGMLDRASSRPRKSVGGEIPSRLPPKPRRPAGRRQTDIGLAKSVSQSRDNAPEVPELSLAELQTELQEILTDQRHLKIRKELVNEDLTRLDHQILKLAQIREDLERSMLSLKEEELELLDEYEGVQDRLIEKERTTQSSASSKLHPSVPQPRLSSTTSRRRRGPAFLPSEHDDLPKNVAFMSLKEHLQPITALDFSSPYGHLVSASTDETLKLWDLASGEVIRNLSGHRGTVKCLQVEDSTCITGGADGQIRVWDLIKAVDEDERSLPRASESHELTTDHSNTPGVNDHSNLEPRPEPLPDGPCVMKLEGHTQPVTALYFDDTCLVSQLQIF